jgi:hypothetical protein
MTYNIMTLRIMTFSIKTFSIKTLSIKTLSISLFSLKTLSIKHRIKTLSKMAFTIKKNISTQSIVMLNAAMLSVEVPSR